MAGEPMTAPHDETAADHQRTIAQLRAALAAAEAREADLSAQLAHRDSEYEERIAHQSATNAVLAALSASPGDPQPVFNLIVERARDLCNGYGATVLEFD